LDFPGQNNDYILFVLPEMFYRIALAQE